MIAKLLISASLGLLISYIASQFLVTAIKNSVRYETQNSLNVLHTNGVAAVNNIRSLREALGLISHDDQVTDLIAASAANTQNLKDIKTCLGSVGTTCKADFDGKTADLSSIVSANSQASKRGAANCIAGQNGSCQFSQVINAVWNCDQPQRCSQLNITVTTKDQSDTTKYNTLVSTLTIAARSLLGRSQINFACANKAQSFFIHDLNYDSGLGTCEAVPHVNTIGSVQNAVPARAIAADTVAQVQNPPKRQECPDGFTLYHVYKGTSECLAIDPNLISAKKGSKAEVAATPVPVDPTPAPTATPEAGCSYVSGPNGAVYDISEATNGGFVGRCKDNFCAGYGIVDNCPQPVTFAEPEQSENSSNGGGSGGKNSGAGGGAGVGGGNGGAGGGSQ